MQNSTWNKGVRVVEYVLLIAVTLFFSYALYYALTHE